MPWAGSPFLQGILENWRHCINRQSHAKIIEPLGFGSLITLKFYTIVLKCPTFLHNMISYKLNALSFLSYHCFQA